jgi:demethylspheroidene O-methyltransferase
MSIHPHHSDASKMALLSSNNLQLNASTAPSESGDSFSERVRKAVDRVLGSPVFYRFSVNSVFTRWFAKYRTQQVFDLMTGFVNFQVLLTCVRYGVLERVYENPCSYDQLIEHIQLPKDHLDRLIYSALSLGLIERRSKNRFGIGALGLPVVSYPGISAMVEHNAVLYADMLDTAKLLKSGNASQMNEYWLYAKTAQPQEDSAYLAKDIKAPPDVDQDKQFAKYSDLMSNSQNFVIDEITTAYDFSNHTKMLDIGCGKGRFISALAQKYPALEFVGMDLPEVIKLTRQNLTDTAFSNRVHLVPASFKVDALPHDIDLVTLVRVAHDHSDDVVAQLLEKIYLSLPHKGTLLLAEPMANAKGARHDAYFHFYLLAMGEGRLRTPERLTQMMLEAGFNQVQILSNPMSMHAKVLIGRKY